MHEGVIVSVKADRGFGFIGERGGPDVFFHAKDLIDLEFSEQLIGRRVKYDVVINKNKPRATYIQPAD